MCAIPLFSSDFLLFYHDLRLQALMEEVTPSENGTRNRVSKHRPSLKTGAMRSSAFCFCVISTGKAECLQQSGPPVTEIPADPPSYPLILDRDPVPEELVRLNST